MKGGRDAESLDNDRKKRGPRTFHGMGNDIGQTDEDIITFALGLAMRRYQLRARGENLPGLEDALRESGIGTVAAWRSVWRPDRIGDHPSTAGRPVRDADNKRRLLANVWAGTEVGLFSTAMARQAMALLPHGGLRDSAFSMPSTWVPHLANVPAESPIGTVLRAHAFISKHRLFSTTNPLRPLTRSLWQAADRKECVALAEAVARQAILPTGLTDDLFDCLVVLLPHAVDVVFDVMAEAGPVGGKLYRPIERSLRFYTLDQQRNAAFITHVGKRLVDAGHSGAFVQGYVRLLRRLLVQCPDGDPLAPTVRSALEAVTRGPSGTAREYAEWAMASIDDSFASASSAAVQLSTQPSQRFRPEGGMTYTGCAWWERNSPRVMNLLSFIWFTLNSRGEKGGPAAHLIAPRLPRGLKEACAKFEELDHDNLCRQLAELVCEAVSSPDLVVSRRLCYSLRAVNVTDGDPDGPSEWLGAVFAELLRMPELRHDDTAALRERMAGMCGLLRSGKAVATLRTLVCDTTEHAAVRAAAAWALGDIGHVRHLDDGQDVVLDLDRVARHDSTPDRVRMSAVHSLAVLQFKAHEPARFHGLADAMPVGEGRAMALYWAKVPAAASR